LTEHSEVLSQIIDKIHEKSKHSNETPEFKKPEIMTKDK
jgi:hypothetical protein